MVTATVRSQEDIKHDIDIMLSELGHTLSPEQQAIVYCSAREVLGGGGERSGKSFVASDYLNVRFWEDDLFWITGKDFETCQEEFEYTAKAMQQLSAVRAENISTPKQGQWTMTLETGAIIKTWSLKDWLKVGREAPGGIIICEVASITLQEYRRLCDRTIEKRGWVCGTGTFESSLGWYPEMWKLYQLPGQQGNSFTMPTWSNRAKFSGYDDPEIQRLKANNTEDRFNERFGGIPSPPHGLVFPEFKYLIHVKEMDVQDAPVYLWIDPGYDGAYAVEAVQIFGEVVHVVDEIYEQGLVTEQVIDVCMQRPWWRLVAGGVADVYALQHQAMPAVAEVWQEKASLYLATNRVEEKEGRDRLHTFLTVNPIDHQPRMFVDPKCTGVLSEFGVGPNPFTGEAGPYKWKEDRVGTVVGKQPEDKNNHGIKAIIYGLIDKFGFVSGSRNKTKSKHPSWRL